ncbi:hypothetical protein KSP39_PZI018677 [Platanthera zijinensis]|uniref:RING-type domain-containing protein n=1 Tax=Platanthera zijinensis TaxID=2320716 RepID=A0AAP0B474_9ASPA
MNSFYTMECKLLSFVRALFVGSEKKEEEEVSAGDGTAEYCVICLCKIERAVHEDHGITSGAVDIALRCGHAFHKHCFDGWVKIQRGKQAPAKTTCPLCRARIDGGGDVNGRLIRSPGNSTDCIVISPFSSDSRIRDLCWIRGPWSPAWRSNPGGRHAWRWGSLVPKFRQLGL